MNSKLKTPFRNIVICGDVGTGTSTLAKGLADKLGWEYVSVGDFFRDYQKRNNIPLWNKAAIPDDIEKKVDSDLLEKMKKEKSRVIDSHYAGWFSRNLDDIFRILLICNKEIATQRIIDRGQSEKETADQIEERREQLKEKFKKLYSSNDYEDQKYFNLVIDTGVNGAEETIETAYKKFLES